LPAHISVLRVVIGAIAAAVGVPESWLTPLGLVKGLGALGIIVGLLGVPVLGAMAAGGLTAFFIGAVVTHLRAHNYLLHFPIAYLLLSLFSLAAFVRA